MLDVAATPVGLVRRNLHFIEVIRKQATPSVSKACTRHAAASEKFDKSVFGHVRE
jgi:hypothetical protein